MNVPNDPQFETAIANAATGIGRIDRSGEWQVGNPALCELLGVPVDELPSAPLPSWFVGEDRTLVEDALADVAGGRLVSAVHELSMERADGARLCVRLDLSAVEDDREPVSSLLVLLEDVTASDQVRRQLESSEARIESVIRTMADGVIVVDQRGDILLANQRAADLLNRSRTDLLSGSLEDLSIDFYDEDERPLPPDRRPAALTLATGRPQRDVTIGMTLEDGSRRWIEISAEPVASSAPDDRAAVVATFSDITRRYRAERQLRDSEERLSLALEGAKIGFWDWDLTTGEFAFSDGAALRLGYSPDDVEPSRDALLELVHPDDRQTLIDAWTAHLEGIQRDFEMDVRMRRKSGGYAWRLIRGRVVRRDDGDRPTRMAGTAMDIGERKRLEARLHELATTDGLTGAANRRHGQERLEAELASADRLGHSVGFVLLDIDHFKRVNDRYGHDVGDRVLKDVAKMLHERVRRTDLVARWGGEEFAVILPGSDAEGAEAFAEEVLESMAELRTPGDEPLSASLGAVAYRAEETVIELVKRADRLMYQAKNSGRARVETQPDPEN